MFLLYLNLSLPLWRLLIVCSMKQVSCILLPTSTVLDVLYACGSNYIPYLLLEDWDLSEGNDITAGVIEISMGTASIGIVMHLAFLLFLPSSISFLNKHQDILK